MHHLPILVVDRGMNHLWNTTTKTSIASSYTHQHSQPARKIERLWPQLRQTQAWTGWWLQKNSLALATRELFLLGIWWQTHLHRNLREDARTDSWTYLKLKLELVEHHLEFARLKKKLSLVELFLHQSKALLAARITRHPLPPPVGTSRVLFYLSELPKIQK